MLEAMRWIDEARKLAPLDSWLADQKIDLLLTLRRPADAHAVRLGLPKDGSFFSLAREGAIVLADRGPQALTDGWPRITGPDGPAPVSGLLDRGRVWSV